MKDLEHMCPYWEICATIQFHSRVQSLFIERVCYTGDHQLCTHYMGVSELSDT